MLTPKRQLFVEAYCVHHNATKAYEEAGFISKNPGKKGSELLKVEDVAAAIQERIDVKKVGFRIQQNEVLEGLYLEATNSNARPAERIQAWTKLGTHLGMFKEKEEETNKSVTYNIINYSSANKQIELKTEEAVASLIEHTGE